MPSAPESPVLVYDQESQTSFQENVVLHNANTLKINVYGNVQINNEIKSLEESEQKSMINNFIQGFLSISLVNIFRFFLLVGATTVFLQDVYFNFQDEQRVSFKLVMLIVIICVIMVIEIIFVIFKFLECEKHYFTTTCVNKATFWKVILLNALYLKNL